MKKKTLLTFGSGVITGMIILGWYLGSSFASWNLPSYNKVNINNWDILTTQIIDNIQSNIENLYNYLKNGFNVLWDVIVNWTVSATTLSWDVIKSNNAYVKSNMYITWSIINQNNDVVLNSKGDNVATFGKDSVVINSKDISLKATWTNKWLRVKSDGSVCIGACW